jgi:hypothetical protein
VDHGEGGQRKIAGRDLALEGAGRPEGASDQEKQEIKGMWKKRRFFRWSDDATVTTI